MEETMPLRSAFLLGLSLMACMAGYLYYDSLYSRYSIVSSPSGLFVFDRKTQVINLCNEKGCRVLPGQRDLLEGAFIPNPKKDPSSMTGLGLSGANLKPSRSQGSLSNSSADLQNPQNNPFIIAQMQAAQKQAQEELQKQQNSMQSKQGTQMEQNTDNEDGGGDQRGTTSLEQGS